MNISEEGDFCTRTDLCADSLAAKAERVQEEEEAADHSPAASDEIKAATPQLVMRARGG